jgi:Kef-type K+ transport system membrane component KefB
MNLIALLLFAAAVGHGISRALRLPAIPLWIGAGMTLNVLGFLPADFALVSGDDEAQGVAMQALEFGLVFLVFTSGVELNPRRFVRHGRTVAWVGLLQFTLSAAVGFFTAHYFGFDTLESTYLGFGLAASSSLVVLRQLQLRHAMFEPFGRVVTGVLLLQDVFLIVIIVALARFEGGFMGLGLALTEVAMLAGTAWLAQQQIIPRLVRRMKPDEESLLLWLMAVLFCFVGIAYWLGLPPIVGAFAGGFAFSAFPLNGLVRGQLASLASFFLALFFVVLGALVGVPALPHWWTALQFSAIVLLLTPPLVAALAEWRGLNTRASIESGLLLAQTSEFSLLLGVSGFALGHISAEGFQILAMTTLITMTLTPFIGQESMAKLLLHLHPFRRRLRLDRPPSGHILVLGFGSAGMWTLKPLRAQGHEILVVDDDAVVCNSLSRLGVPVMRGDGSEEHVLNRAGARNAKLIIASMRRVGDAITVLHHAKGIPVIVRVFEESEAELVRAAGGTPILNSDAATETFLAWFQSSARLKTRSILPLDGTAAESPPQP